MKEKYYAIKIGRNTENKIVNSWDECSELVLGCNSIFKSFNTEEEAKKYLINMSDFEISRRLKNNEYYGNLRRMEKLEEEAKQNKTYTIEELIKKLEEKYNVSISKNAIELRLYKNNVSPSFFEKTNNKKIAKYKIGTFYFLTNYIDNTIKKNKKIVLNLYNKGYSTQKIFYSLIAKSISISRFIIDIIIKEENERKEKIMEEKEKIYTLDEVTLNIKNKYGLDDEDISDTTVWKFFNKLGISSDGKRKDLYVLDEEKGKISYKKEAILLFNNLINEVIEKYSNSVIEKLEKMKLEFGYINYQTLVEETKLSRFLIKIIQKNYETKQQTLEEKKIDVNDSEENFEEELDQFLLEQEDLKLELQIKKENEKLEEENKLANSIEELNEISKKEYSLNQKNLQKEILFKDLLNILSLSVANVLIIKDGVEYELTNFDNPINQNLLFKTYSEDFLNSKIDKIVIRDKAKILNNSIEIIKIYLK